MSSLDTINAPTVHPPFLIIGTTSCNAHHLNQAALQRLITDPRYHGLLSIVKAARNGAVYGARVRLPHALVTMLLFRPGGLAALPEKLALVMRATRQHARNLAEFACLYKSAMLALKHLGATPGKEGPYDSFFAGLLGGYVVFGRTHPRTGRPASVTQQIVIYVFARVCLALARLAVKPGVGLPLISRPRLSREIEARAWPAFAALSWASVMFLFRWHPDELQPTLRSSMHYIYVQSGQWDSLRTLLWRDK